MIHINYSHEPGYLIGCNACEFGPCVCAGTDNAECVSLVHEESDPNSENLFTCDNCGDNTLTLEQLQDAHGEGMCEEPEGYDDNYYASYNPSSGQWEAIY